jgi:hypothetical protein
MEEPKIHVRRSREFKLKPQYNKNFQVIRLHDFGFVPETLVFERVRPNWFAVSAVLTPEEVKKQEERDKKVDETIKDIKKKGSKK